MSPLDSEATTDTEATTRRAARSGVRPGIPIGSGAAYWRALDELAGSPEFEREVASRFPSAEGALASQASRRSFLKLMGASLALAGVGGVSGCLRWPREKILPFTGRPEGRLPGQAAQYATAMEVSGIAHPLVVTSLDGRPIKIEGNPEHPASGGTSNAWQQASVLGLYDPVRSRELLERTGGGWTFRSWDEFQKEIGRFRARQGEGLCILRQASSSPTFARLAAKLPKARFFEWEPLSRDHEREGTRLLFGKPLRVHYHLDGAKSIVALDSDFLMSHPDQLRLARDYARGRRADDAAKSLSRLRVMESFHSITGSVADERYACSAQDIAAHLAYIARGVAQRGVALPTGLGDVEGACAAASAVRPNPGTDAIVSDLVAHAGESAILVGPRQPAAVHALAHALNVALGNAGAGKPVRFHEDPTGDRPQTHIAGLRELAGLMHEEKVQALVILEGNPVFDAPCDLAFGDALGKVPFVAHLSLYLDETSQRARWHLPAAHFLEAWGDCRSYDGRLSITQPLIAPLYAGKTACEVLSMIADEKPQSSHDLVRATHATGKSTEEEHRWRRALHDGVVAESESDELTPRPRGGWGASLQAAIQRGGKGMEAVFIEDYSIYDGRFANNGWLLEMPDPMTKLAWDNAAILGVGKAKELGVENGDFVEVTVGGRTKALPVYVLPGQANESVTIPLGYGRKLEPPPATGDHVKVAGAATYNRVRSAAVADTPVEGVIARDMSLLHRPHGGPADSVGFDTYTIRPAEALEQASVPAQVRKGSGKYKLATTQTHHPIDLDGEHLWRWSLGSFTAERLGELVRTQHIENYRKHPEGIRHYVHLPKHIASLWKDATYAEGPRWGMSIDLSTCTGCTACVVACQAENNTPVTGKYEVAYGREMHWIRIDRYFAGKDADAPRVAHQPVTCHQCENAPCEQVCPVAATVHSTDGLNDMVYNRCIGTRYCSNNCPYKVRRFNYFNNFHDAGPIEAMVYNPDVSIRHRGVMEKCTYCVQRIRRGGIRARSEGRKLADGEITPACAQACPTQAITFGDLNDAESRVAKLHRKDRAYKMLEELNVRPRTAYLARLTNGDEVEDFTPRNPADPEGNGHGGEHDPHGSGQGEREQG